MGKMNKPQIAVRSDLFTGAVEEVETDEILWKGDNNEKSSSDYDFIFDIGNSTEGFFLTQAHNDENVIGNDTGDNAMPAILIEVPHVIAEETVDYTDLSNIVIAPDPNYEKDLDTNSKVVSTDGDITIIPDSAAQKCFLVENGSETQPLYIVKSEHLKEECSILNKNTKESKANRKINRSSKVNKTTEKKQLKNTSSVPSKSGDLMWLLNFKLDDIGSVPFEPLDETPEPVAKSDAKAHSKGDSNVANEKRNEANDEPEEAADDPSPSPLKKKPPFTYTELIECALEEKGPLTVSEIYRWISDTFPYYKAWDDRWKNSVRHNLSINPYFRKGTKARQGSGHLWTVSKSAASAVKNSNWKRQRYHEFEEYTKKMRIGQEEDAREAALAAANIEDKENQEVHNDVLLTTHNSVISMEASLEQSAEEILSGVKRNVAVEYIHEPPRMSTDDKNDFFIHPVSKEVLMGECGLLNQIELNLTAETADQLVESEHTFELPEDLVFQYVDSTNQGPQLLSLAN